MPECAPDSNTDSLALTLSTVQLIGDIVRQIVVEPDRVEITTLKDDRKVTLKMSVAPDDIGRVIGRQGRTARALRILLAAVSNKSGLLFELDIEEHHT